MQTQILVNEGYCIHSIKFRFLFLILKKIKNQTLKFDVTDKIKVNTITINKVYYMTYWHENELYITIRMTY